jgi:Ca-activated chloride channel family protein
MESTCLLNYDILSVGAQHKLYLLVRVQGSRQEGERKSLPLNLSVVIDRSGSMAGEKLEFVKQAALDLVRRLGAKDQLSLVAYDTEVEVLVPPMGADNKAPFARSIHRLQSRASTNLSGGWLQGCEFVARSLAEKQVNRVLLLTDGLANVGVTDPPSLAAMARQKRAEGITTTTLGVGMHFNEDLLTTMASEGGGAFYFIDSPDQAPAIFGEELQDLLNVVGQNLTVAIEAGKAVRGVQQLYDYPRHEETGALVYKLGDLYAEEERHQVFELTLAPLEQGETKLGRIVVSYDAIQGEQVKRVESAFEILVKAVPESELEVVLPKLDVEKLALLQKAARAREKAIQHADRGAFEQAAKVLRDVAAAIEASGLEDEELQQAHGQLIEDAMDMELGPERYDAHTRKLQSAKIAHSSRSARSAPMVEAMHTRLRSERVAIERGGPAPAWIAWGQRSLELKEETLLIGSSEGCDIVLKSPGVAPKHCRLEQEAGDWFLVDLGAAETFANGGRVSRRFRLSVGDVLAVGGTVLRMADVNLQKRRKTKGI